MIQGGGGRDFQQQQQQQQQQPRLFNRMSDFFQKRQRALAASQHASGGDYGPGTSMAVDSASSAMITSSIAGTASIYSAMDEDTASRVDSMFSSIQSNQSNVRPNPNTPPPLRTVHLDHQQQHQQQQLQHHQSTSPHDLSPQHATSSIYTMSSPLARSSGSPPLDSSTYSSSTISTTSREADDVEEAFQKLAREYGIPEEVAKTFTPERKKVLLTSQAQIQEPTSSNGFFSWRTWGKKQKQRTDIRQGSVFDQNQAQSSQQAQLQGTTSSTGSSGKKWKMGYSTSARGRMQRVSIMTYQDGKRSFRQDRTMKTGLSPEDFIELLRGCHVRELDESQVQELRVCLRSVKASWTTTFVQLGGYAILSDLFRQMKEAPKREKNDDKILQHLSKCFKAIMTHEQAGTEMVLTNPIGLEHIRDLLFGPVNQKQKQLYGLSVITRAHFLNILCTLSSLQFTRPASPGVCELYVHGYDVLRHLLLDCPATTVDPTAPSTTIINIATLAAGHGIDAPANASRDADGDNELPFRMTLKADPKDTMRFILHDDPLAAEDQPPTPRYTAWMRELQYTVEKEIEPITFLAQVLDYKFESAFRQLRIKPPTQQDHEAAEYNDVNAAPHHNDNSAEKQTANTVMVDDGVVEYLIAHLRLMNTVIATPPIFYKGPYEDLEREKVRTEIMMSGFDKISKALRHCPHPTLYALYYRYLSPLLQPLADLQAAMQHAMQLSMDQEALMAMHANNGGVPWPQHHSGIDEYGHGYGDDGVDDVDDDESEYIDEDDDDEDWVDEEEDTVDPLAYTDYMDEDMEYLTDAEDEDQVSTYSNFDREHRWKMYASTAR